MRWILILGAAAMIWAGGASTRSEQIGQDLFQRRCGGCHALDQDKEGPRLRGVVGRTAGSAPSFQYSEALKKSGIVWNAEKLERWLADPEALAPGNDMAFHVESAPERRAIIEYLQGEK